VSGTASYNLQLSTVNSTNTYTGITDTTYMVKGLARLTNYTWKVEAINAGGTSYFTGANAFTTIVAAPAVPAAVLPASAAAGVNRLARFVWNSVLNATKYRLQIATDNAFATIVTDTTVALDTVCTLTSALLVNSDYYWRVNAQNLGGASAYSTARLFTTGTVLAVDEIVEVPTVFDLMQNYPNPFNPSTIIRYDVPSNANVKIIIYDILGREVTTLVNAVQVAGRYNLTWNASGLATGVYIYRMEAQPESGAATFTSVKKLLLMK
jgi:Secretion system C-terminal sorting domain